MRIVSISLVLLLVASVLYVVSSEPRQSSDGHNGIAVLANDKFVGLAVVVKVEKEKSLIWVRHPDDEAVGGTGGSHFKGVAGSVKILPGQTFEVGDVGKKYYRPGHNRAPTFANHNFFVRN